MRRTTSTPQSPTAFSATVSRSAASVSAYSQVLCSQEIEYTKTAKQRLPVTEMATIQTKISGYELQDMRKTERRRTKSKTASASARKTHLFQAHPRRIFCEAIALSFSVLFLLPLKHCIYLVTPLIPNIIT